MKVIVEHYRGEKFFDIQEVEDNQLNNLSRQEKYVEMDFKMQIEYKQQLPALTLFKKQSMLFATIGTKQLSDRVDAFYNMGTDTLEIINKRRPIQETYWVSLYTDEDELSASCYIQSINKLTKWAETFQKPLVIYSEVVPKEQYYRYRSLTGKVINHLLEKVNGVLVMYKPKSEIAAYYTPSHKAFEFYIERGIYLSCAYEEMIRRITDCLQEGPTCDFRQVYRSKRQYESLYDDLFYEMIPDTEKIYVPFIEDGIGTASYLKQLGLKVIQGISAYGLIYDTKDKINSKSHEIRSYVVPRYESPILERGYLRSTILQQPYESYQVVSGDLAYKGNGVYIAIVSKEGVDYRLSTLRNKDGTTRIAGIWHQIEGDKGTFYTREQINEALQSEKPEEIVPIDENSDENTMLLTIAGGKTEGYEGIASESEFLIAQVNGASKSLQTIYGGMPNTKNILMGDLMVGVWNLQRFARMQNKPVVFYIPYYATVDGHDGLSPYNLLLAGVSMTGDNAVIVSTGEEGDKQHHQTLYDDTMKAPIVNLNVLNSQENIIGIVAQQNLTSWQIKLTSPSGNKVYLTQAGVYELDDATIYSQGEKFNYYSGAKEVMFRISPISKGTWQLEVSSEDSGNNRVDLWISGVASNPYVTLSPYNPYVTIGSLGNIASVICVGGYNLNDMTTLGSSGRGYTTHNRVKPNLGAEGVLETISVKGERVQLQGAAVSASFIVGAAATIFEKWQVEKGKSYLNGPLLNSILLEYTTRFKNLTFPNPNQGYGVFEKETLNQILLTPFNP